MVKLKEVQAGIAQYVLKESLVVVSAGGSSGIGEATIQQLCIAAGKTDAKGAGLRLYLIARREEAAQKVMVELNGFAPKAEIIFIRTPDLSLLQNVDKACLEIAEVEKAKSGDAARIDLLLLSQAVFDPWSGRADTAEGIAINMALLYYSRMRMIDQLLPLLLARSESDSPAHIVSVHAAGAETMGKLHKDDLSLRQGYGFGDARTNVVYMTTMFFEHLANDHPGKLSLVHVHPGLVIHSSFAGLLARPTMPLWVRILSPILLPVAKLTVATPVPESGQRTLFLGTDHYPANDSKRTPKSSPVSRSIAMATNGKVGAGAYACKASNDTLDVTKHYTKLRTGGFYDQVWTHTQEAFATIAAGKIFTT